MITVHITADLEQRIRAQIEIAENALEAMAMLAHNEGDHTPPDPQRYFFISGWLKALELVLREAVEREPDSGRESDPDRESDQDRELDNEE